MDNQDFSAEEVFFKLGIDYKKKGDHLMARCPFHDEKTPSFYFSTSKNVGNCFGCGKGVNLWTLVKELTGSNLLKLLGITDYSKTNIAYSKSLSKLAPKEESVKKESGYLSEIDIIAVRHDPYSIQESKEYCLSRNITPEDIKKYSIFYIDDGYIGVTRYIKRLVIPVVNKLGIPVAYEGRDVTRLQDKKCIYNYQCKIGSTVFDHENLDYDKRVVWVEGVLDKLQVEKALPDEQVSSYFGIQLTNNQKEIVNRFKKSILMLDSDAGGERGIENISEFIERDFEVSKLDFGDPNESTLGSIQKAFNQRISSTRYFMNKYGILQPEDKESNFLSLLNS